jgi:PmbA protein
MTNLPLSHDEAREAASRILDLPGADGVEVVVAASDTGLTRYANSEIIQNTVRREVRAYVRVALADRSATATTNQLGDVNLRAAAERALEAAQASPPDPDFPGLPAVDEVGRAESCFRWDDATQAAPASTRAQAVQEILKAAGSDNAAGIYETSAHCFGVFSSRGIDCFDAYTRCCTTVLVDTGSATGWSESWGHAMTDVDVAATARRAAEKASRGGEPIDIEPSAFEVVLEPPAVATLLEYLAYSGFGAKQVIEGESFLATKTGSAVAAPHITVADDVSHPGSIGIGFDLEGHPKKRVAVIDSGTATGPVSDLRTARKLGTESTGHASGSNEFGPYASNIVLEGGDTSTEELIGGVKDGLLVTRFHYVNILDRPETLLTGMTRDGTFKIVDGEVAQPVHNLRFTQSVLEALASAVAVGSEVQTFGPEWGAFGSTATPALRIGEFRFTSGTSH